MTLSRSEGKQLEHELCTGTDDPPPMADSNNSQLHTYLHIYIYTCNMHREKQTLKDT